MVLKNWLTETYRTHCAFPDETDGVDFSSLPPCFSSWSEVLCPKTFFISYFLVINRKLKIEMYTSIPTFSCPQIMCFPDTENFLWAQSCTFYNEEAICSVFLCTRNMSSQAAIIVKGLYSVPFNLVDYCLDRSCLLFLPSPPNVTERPVSDFPCIPSFSIVFGTYLVFIKHLGKFLIKKNKHIQKAEFKNSPPT